jgi:hypothetical protein
LKRAAAFAVCDLVELVAFIISASLEKASSSLANVTTLIVVAWTCTSRRNRYLVTRHSITSPFNL